MHCLAGTLDATIDNVEEIWSHPQAIMQSKNYIDMHKFKIVDETNTAVAAQKISLMNNKKAAAICSVEAANNYNLKVLDEKINHQEHNSTKFAAISKTLWLDQSHNKVSIVFTVPRKTGTLNNVLSIFSYYNINLSSIYSRPDLKSPWKYLFYIDFEGNTLSHDVRAVLYQLKKELPFIKILGSYKA